MGESTRQGAETFHDNAPFDAARDQFGLVSTRLGELVRMRENARILGEADFVTGQVGFGRVITTLNLGTKEEQRWQISSYRAFAERPDDGPKPLSYTAPLARLLRGAIEGEEREGKIGGKMRRFKIVKIE